MMGHCRNKRVPKRHPLALRGDAVFAGGLAAASGTFAGSLSAASGSFVGDVTIAAPHALEFDSGSGSVCSLTPYDNAGLGTALRIAPGDGADWLEIRRLPAQVGQPNDLLGLRWQVDGVQGEISFSVGNGVVGTMNVAAGFAHLGTGPLGFFGAPPTNRPVVSGTVGSTTWATSIENALVSLGLVSR